MGISAVSITTLTNFPQMNREITVKGQQAASARSEQAAAYTKVSNFGNETKLGTSKFQQANKQADQIGMEKTSQLMDKAKSYFRVSNFGNETNLGKSKFQQINAQIMKVREQAYTQFRDFQQKATGTTVDIGA